MKPNQKILACVDQSHFADTVADYAAWAAIRLEAPLEFLHVIDREPEVGTGDDHSGTIGIDAQEQLLATLSERDATRTREAREQGRLFLNRLRMRAIAAGVPAPDVRQRHGALDETLMEQEQGVRLFVLGRRGASAEITRRDIGRNVEQIIRSLHRPILAVTDEFRDPRRLLIAFDGSGATRRAVELVSASPLFRDLPIHVLMSGHRRSDATKQLEWARGELAKAGFQVTTAHVPGDPERVIAQTVRDLRIDVLVMGAYTHSRLRSLFLGSRTNDLLRSATIPTLLLR